MQHLISNLILVKHIFVIFYLLILAYVRATGNDTIIMKLYYKFEISL